MIDIKKIKHTIRVYSKMIWFLIIGKARLVKTPIGLYYEYVPPIQVGRYLFKK